MRGAMADDLIRAYDAGEMPFDVPIDDRTDRNDRNDNPDITRQKMTKDDKR